MKIGFQSRFQINEAILRLFSAFIDVRPRYRNGTWYISSVLLCLIDVCWYSQIHTFLQIVNSMDTIWRCLAYIEGMMHSANHAFVIFVCMKHIYWNIHNAQDWNISSGDIFIQYNTKLFCILVKNKSVWNNFKIWTFYQKIIIFRKIQKAKREKGNACSVFTSMGTCVCVLAHI